MKFIFLLFTFITTALALPSYGYQSSLNSPYVSANTLFLYRESSAGKEDNSTDNRNGFDLEEAELAFYSDVDPYTRLTMLLSLHPEYTLSGSSVNEEFKLEPEELYVDSNALSAVTFRVGQFKAFFGKHNTLHTHMFPFIEAPLVNTALLGGEGLNDVGVSANILLPTPWYNEWTLQVLRGAGENSEFNSETPGDRVALTHWKNLFDFSDSLTGEVGLSYAAGNNSLGGTTQLRGADLTFKYRPIIGGKYKSWIIGTEYIQRILEQPQIEKEDGQGWNLWGKYQFAERWSALTRYDYLKVKNANSGLGPDSLDNGRRERYSGAIIFAASEFSSYEFEYDYTHSSLTGVNSPDERAAYIRANFTIGAHPAHAY